MITPDELAARENAAFILILIATCVTVFALTLSTYAIWILWRYRDQRTYKTIKSSTSRPSARRRVAMFVPVGLRRSREHGRVNAEIVVPAHTSPTVPLPVLPAPTVSPTIADAARRNESGYVVCSDVTRVLVSE